MKDFENLRKEGGSKGKGQVGENGTFVRGNQVRVQILGIYLYADCELIERKVEHEQAKIQSGGSLDA